jgi:hypothetical protein
MVTSYRSKHPGIQLFLKYAGTKQFNDARHIDAYNYMDDLCVGKVKLEASYNPLYYGVIGCESPIAYRNVHSYNNI